MEFRDSGREFHPLENMVDVKEYDIDTQVRGLGRLIAFKYLRGQRTCRGRFI